MKKLLVTSSVLAILAGIVLVAGGIWGIYFTYKNVANEKIVTPKDSAIPEKPVRGVLTLKAQADIIREHTFANDRRQNIFRNASSNTEVRRQRETSLGRRR